MVQERRAESRDRYAERRERLRYQLLERLYLLTGPECAEIVLDGRAEMELGLSLNSLATVVEDLERLGYLDRCGAGSRVRVTPSGMEYLRQGAWRRRSIRN